MPFCSSCGSEIPDGQGRSCSMCYGDPGHGRDGYYANWLKEKDNAEQAQQAALDEEEPCE